MEDRPKMFKVSYGQIGEPDYIHFDVTEEELESLKERFNIQNARLSNSGRMLCIDESCILCRHYLRPRGEDRCSGCPLERYRTESIVGCSVAVARLACSLDLITHECDLVDIIMIDQQSVEWSVMDEKVHTKARILLKTICRLLDEAREVETEKRFHFEIRSLFKEEVVANSREEAEKILESYYRNPNKNQKVDVSQAKEYDILFIKEEVKERIE